MAIETRLTSDPKELEKIYQFRFKVYYQELGAQLPDSVIRAGFLRDDMDEVAYHYVSLKEGEVVGCLRVCDFQDLEDAVSLMNKYSLQPAVDELGEKAITFTGRMVVAAHCRKSSLVFRLMALATEEARGRNIRIAFLDCSPQLLPFYEAFGFKRYAPAFCDPVFGLKQPLLFMLRDRVGLDAVGSPLSRTGPPYEDDVDIRTWYTNHYPTYRKSGTTSIVQHDDLRDLVARHIEQNFSLFLRGLTKHQIDLVLKKATIVTVKSGDIVIRPGLRDDHLCIVLSGQLAATDQEGRTVGLQTGDLFGEREILTRTARAEYVQAVENCDILVLPGEYTLHLIEKDVIVGRSLLRNLATWLALRSTRPSRIKTQETSLPQESEAYSYLAAAVH